MAEAESEDQVEDVCRRIAAVVNEHLGETASADAVR
jgi:hypothetical protein